MAQSHDVSNPDFCCDSYWSSHEIGDGGKPFRHGDCLRMIAAMPGTTLAPGDAVVVDHEKLMKNHRTMIVRVRGKQVWYRVYRSMTVRDEREWNTGNLVEQLSEHKRTDEMTMKFEKKFFLSGQDLSEVDDSWIFDKIAKMEKEIEKLQAIQTKPEKLRAQIAEYQDTIKSLAKYVDNR